MHAAPHCVDMTLASTAKLSNAELGSSCVCPARMSMDIKLAHIGSQMGSMSVRWQDELNLGPLTPSLFRRRNISITASLEVEMDGVTIINFGFDSRSVHLVLIYGDDLIKSFCFFSSMSPHESMLSMLY